jgi:hypothetical protein
LLLDCHPHALVESVRAFLKALNPAFILVGKSDLRRSDRRLLSRLLFWRDARKQKKDGNNTSQAHNHGFSPPLRPVVSRGSIGALIPLLLDF